MISWIIFGVVTAVFLVYVFTREEDYGWFSGLEALVEGTIGLILYLIFIIIWLIV